jgi:glutathione S-transferase
LEKKISFPFLVDENTGTQMYESDKIIQHLWENYGQGGIEPLSFRILGKGKLNMFSSFLASILRPDPSMGVLRTPSKNPEEPLQLWSYEGCPYSRIVREKLCTLEIPYYLHNMAHGSSKREEFKSKYGKLQFPFLSDPNTNWNGFESGDIVGYLDKTYKIGEMVQETWSDYSTKGATNSHGTIGSKKKAA